MTVWWLLRFIREPAKATLLQWVTAGKKKNQQEGKLTTDWQVDSYWLKTYATEKVIFKAEAEIKSLKKPAGMTATR